MRYIVVIFFLFATFAYSTTPTVDVRNLQTVKPLDGQWAFSYGSLNFNAEQTFSVPSYWENHGMNAQGCATYELVLLTNPNKALTIDVSRPHTAYKLFMDGVLLGTSGEIDEATLTSKPSYKNELIAWTPTRESSKMTLWVCNHSHRHGGLAKAPKIALTGLLENKASVNSKIQWLLAGVLLTMGLYHIGLYSAWRKQKAPLWFGLVCFSLLLRMSSTADKILLSAFPSLSWDALVRIEYISGYVSLPLFVLYLGALYPSQTPRLAGRIFFTVGAVFASIVVVLPPIYFTATLPYYEVVVVVFLAFISLVLYRSCKMREQNAYTALAGFGIFGICIVHDLLMMAGFIGGGDWIALGFVFYLLVQAKLLIERYVGAFQEAQKHQAQLENLNLALEDTINKRTLALRDMLEQRDLLLREINHRVKNNLQFIIGLLWLQQNSQKQQPCDDQMAELQRQIKAIANVHEMLCMQKDFAHLNAKEYIEHMLSWLGQLHADISFELGADDNCELGADNAIAVGLIINELITNSAKHGFKKSNERRIIISFIKNELNYILSYSDGENDFDLDEQKGFGLGSSMIRDLCKQLGTTPVKQQVNGTLNIEFPIGAKK